MTAHAEVKQKLWRNYDPYGGFPYKMVKPDMQGWQSQHRYLSDSVAHSRPETVVEVGVWKGGSCLELARSVQAHGLQGQTAVIAVDTWLGSAEHWQFDHWHEELGFEFGYPTIYRTFLANMISGGVSDVVVPLPLDSANAYQVLRQFDIRPALVHIDGAHDYDAAWSDLSRWWIALEPGGIMIIDDYDLDGHCWPGTYEAVNKFIKETEVFGFESENLKCRFRKDR